MLADGLDGLPVDPPDGYRTIIVENPEILELGSTSRTNPLQIKIRLKPGDKDYTIKVSAELLAGPDWEKVKAFIATWLHGGPAAGGVLPITIREIRSAR